MKHIPKRWTNALLDITTRHFGPSTSIPPTPTWAPALITALETIGYTCTPTPQPSRGLPAGAVVVTTGEYASHNYPIGQPCMALSSGDCYMLRQDGTTGNCHNASAYRPATRAEIVAFLRALPDNRDTIETLVTATGHPKPDEDDEK